MMKRTVAVAIAALALMFSAGAQADTIGFVGLFNPGTWTTNFLGTLNLTQGGGPGSTTINPTTLNILGGNTGIAPPGVGCTSGNGTCEIDFVHSGGFLYKFHWSYNTADDPGFDPFGIIVDGNHIPLSITNGTSGDVVVGAKSNFGWFINCTDCTSGAASAVVTGFAAAPEPTSLMLLGLGLSVLAIIRKAWA
ncbi:MAG TPA: PEP-CTERM sorting domain-containing protein [Candidatus Binatia bacterium]